MPPDTLDILDNTARQPAVNATSDTPDATPVDPKDTASASSATPPPNDQNAADLDAGSADEGAAGDSSVSTDAQATPPKKAGKGGVQSRIDELTRQREENKRALEQERQARLALEARLAEVENAKLAAAKADPEEGPKRADYDDPDAYAEARAEWIARETLRKSAADEAKAITAQREKEARERAEAEAAKVTETFLSREKVAKTEYEDFDAVAYREDVVLPNPVLFAIQTSEIGPHLSYYFGKNPDEAKRLMGLHPSAAVRELGRIEARILSERSNTQSSAPAPINAVRSGRGSTRVDPEQEPMDDYYKRRSAELRAKH